jgi:hypothetical protein
MIDYNTDMKRKSTRSSRAAVRTLERRRTTLVEILLQNEEVVLGTVSEVLARCGKSGCRCTRGQGHPQMRLLYAEGGRRRCKLVRKADEERIRAAGQRYRQLRAALRDLATLDSRELRLLRDILNKRGARYK